MEVKKSFTVNASLNKTWSLLSDPMKIVTCVPGAKITEQIDDKNYKGVIEVKIGPVLSKYEGDAILEECDNENYILSLVGKGIDSKGKGSASMNMKGNLKAISETVTEVESSMTMDITGKVAQLGSRMITAVNNQMFEQFKNNFITTIENEEGEEIVDVEDVESKPIGAIGLGAKVVAGGIAKPFKKLFGRGKSKDEDTDTSQDQDNTSAD